MHEKERGAWCGMKEYKEAEKQVEKIKESEDVGELERFLVRIIWPFSLW